MHNSIVAPKRGHTGKKPFTFIAVVDYSILKEKETFVLQGGNWVEPDRKPGNTEVGVYKM